MYPSGDTSVDSDVVGLAKLAIIDGLTTKCCNTRTDKCPFQLFSESA